MHQRVHWWIPAGSAGALAECNSNSNIGWIKCFGCTCRCVQFGGQCRGIGDIRLGMERLVDSVFSDFSRFWCCVSCKSVWLEFYNKQFIWNSFVRISTNVDVELNGICLFVFFFGTYIFRIFVMYYINFTYSKYCLLQIILMIIIYFSMWTFPFIFNSYRFWRNHIKYIIFYNSLFTTITVRRLFQSSSIILYLEELSSSFFINYTRRVYVIFMHYFLYRSDKTKNFDNLTFRRKPCESSI